MKIKVIKANKKSYWYSDNIGEIFDAEVASEEQQDEYGVGYVIGTEEGTAGCRFFDSDDVEEVIE